MALFGAGFHSRWSHPACGSTQRETRKPGLARSRSFARSSMRASEWTKLSRAFRSRSTISAMQKVGRSRIIARTKAAATSTCCSINSDPMANRLKAWAHSSTRAAQAWISGTYRIHRTMSPCAWTSRVIGCFFDRSSRTNLRNFSRFSWRSTCVRFFSTTRVTKGSPPLRSNVSPR